MSGKRKPLVHCNDNSSSGSDEDTNAVIEQQISCPKSVEESCPASGSSPQFQRREQKLLTLSKNDVSNGLIARGKKKRWLNSTALPKCPIRPEGEVAVVGESTCKQNQGKCRMKKEPLPMKLRALPQSFWQQPNATIDISPGQIYAKLPPLLSKDVSDDIRSPCPSSIEVKSESKMQRQIKNNPQVSEADWIFQLFDVLDQNSKSQPGKRGRPKKIPPVISSPIVRTEDPVLGTTASTSTNKHLTVQPATLTTISFTDTDKSVSLPALNIEKSYSQMLSEVVIKL